MKFDFANAKTVDALAGKVPDNFHPFYEEAEGGGYQLRDDPVVKAAVSSISGFNSTTTKLRAELDAAQKSAGDVDLTALSEFGSTVGEIKDAVQAKIDEAAKSGKAGADDAIKRGIDKAKQEMANAHAAELDAIKKRSQGLEGQLYHRIISDEATKELVAAGADPELVMPHIAPKLQPVEKDGKYGVQVIGDDGERRYSGVTGDPMSIKELVQEFKANERFGKLFGSEAPSGGGTNPNQRRAPAGPGKDTRSATEKIKAGLDAGAFAKS